MLIVMSFPLTACDTANLDDPAWQKEQAARLLAAAPLTIIADGQVYGSGVGTNIWAVWRVIQQQPNAIALMNPARTQVIFAVPTAVDTTTGLCNWWFSMIDIGKFQLTSTALKHFPQLGNITNGSSFGTLVDTAVKNGWKVVKPDEFPWTFRLALTSAMNFIAYSSSQALSDFLVVPILDNGHGWQEPVIDLIGTDS